MLLLQLFEGNIYLPYLVKFVRLQSCRPNMSSFAGSKVEGSHQLLCTPRQFSAPKSTAALKFAAARGLRRRMLTTRRVVAFNNSSQAPSIWQY